MHNEIVVFFSLRMAIEKVGIWNKYTGDSDDGE
jgi:hypothetical protein